MRKDVTPSENFDGAENLWENDHRYIYRDQVRLWLDQLEAQLQNGSCDALEEKIRLIRTEL